MTQQYNLQTNLYYYGVQIENILRLQDHFFKQNGEYSVYIAETFGHDLHSEDSRTITPHKIYYDAMKAIERSKKDIDVLDSIISDLLADCWAFLNNDEAISVIGSPDRVREALRWLTTRQGGLDGCRPVILVIDREAIDKDINRRKTIPEYSFIHKGETNIKWQITDLRLDEFEIIKQVIEI